MEWLLKGFTKMQMQMGNMAAGTEAQSKEWERASQHGGWNAVAGETLPNDLEDTITQAMGKHGLAIGEEKTWRTSLWKHLGTQMYARVVQPQKVLVANPKLETLDQLQELIGSMQWLRQFALLALKKMKIFMDLLQGDTDLTAPRRLLPTHQKSLQSFFSHVQTGGLARWELGKGIQAHILLQHEGVVIILHQGDS